ncbi:MAG: STAS domain-containing protein [Magnetococcales bacterium]|nr:STAS domain-containing protein [Magnetococcales bacterium]
MPGTVSVTRTDQAITIKIKGRFTYKIHAPFRAAYRDGALDQGFKRRFIIDLASTEYIDSSALGMLLVLRGKTYAHEAQIEIINARPEVRKVLEIANFHLLFKIT